MLAANVGLTSRPFDSANPELDLRLPDGSRLSAVMSVTSRPAVSLRRSRLGKVSLGDLVGNATMTSEMASFLRAAVRARKNIMIAGATNSGKTTLLRALANEIPPTERLITVERSLELGLDAFDDLHPNVVAFEERLSNSEGVGGVGMADLVRRSLRMNPSRVIVGEVLGDEIVTMLNAMSQGNDGSLSTIHANSSMEVFNRIATYALQAQENLPVEATHMLIAGSINFVVFLKRRNAYESGGTLAALDRECARGDRRRRPGALERGLPARSRRTRVGPRADQLHRRARVPRLRSRSGGSRMSNLSVQEAVLFGGLVGLGLFTLVLAFVGLPQRPAGRPTKRRRARAAEQRSRQLVLGLIGGVAGLVLTRWIVATVALALLGAFWDRIAGGEATERIGIARLEAMASWTESLRDTIAGAVGLEQAIPATSVNAGVAIRPSLNLLVDRLRIREPLPDALLAFAEDIDDPSADVICAALVLNARLRGPGLRDVLSALAVSAREELDMRRRIEASRKSIRRSVRIVLIIVLGVMGGLTVFNRHYVKPYGSASGQLVLLIVAFLIAAGLWWLRRLASPKVTGRFLVQGRES